MSLFDNIHNIHKATKFDLCVQSFEKTCEQVNFNSLLDFSFNKSVVFCSDYGGEHEKSKYYTYTFVFTSFSSLQAWHEKIANLKQTMRYSGPPEYKHIKVKSRGEKLRDWFSVSERLKAFIVCFAIPVKIDSVFAQNSEDLLNSIRLNSSSSFSNCTFKPKILEKAFRVTSFAGLVLSAILENDGYHCLWMSDRDSIFEGPKPQEGDFTPNLLASILDRYNPQLKLDERRWATPPWQNDTGNLYEDFLSLSDLISGAVSNYCDVWDERDCPQQLYKKLHPKSVEILSHTKAIPTYIYRLIEQSGSFSAERISFTVQE